MANGLIYEYREVLLVGVEGCKRVHAVKPAVVRRDFLVKMQSGAGPSVGSSSGLEYGNYLPRRFR